MQSDTVLACSHTVCRHCWQELVDNERLVCFNKCPMCRHVILTDTALRRRRASADLVLQGRILVKYTALWAIAIIVVQHDLNTMLMFWLSPMMLYTALLLYDVYRLAMMAK